MTSRRSNLRAPLLPGRGPLDKVPPAVAFLLVIALFGLGVWLRGPVGAALLGVLLLGVAGLLGTTWSRLSAPARIARIAVLAVLAAVLVSILR